MDKVKQFFQKTKKYKRPALILIFLVTALTAGGLLLSKEGTDAVSIANVKKNAVLTSETVNASFQQVGGKVVTIDVKEGDRVKAGDSLITLDTTDLEQQTKEIHVNLSKLDVQIAQANDKIASAKQKANIGEQKATVGIEKATTSELAIEKGTRSEDIAQQEIAIQSAEQSVILAEESVKMAEQAVATAQENLVLLQTNVERTQALYDSGLVSLSELEQVQNKLTNAQAQVEAAMMQVDAAREQKKVAENGVLQQQLVLEKMQNGATEEDRKQAQLATEQAKLSLAEAQQAAADIESEMHNITLLQKEKEKLNLQLEKLETTKSRMTLVAPADGKITKIIPKVGENVGTGATSVLIDTETLYFEIYVPEEQYVTFNEGSSLDVKIIPLNKTVEGTVQLVSTAPKYASMRMTGENGMDDISTFLVRINVAKESELAAGMTVEVNFNETVH